MQGTLLQLAELASAKKEDRKNANALRQKANEFSDNARQLSRQIADLQREAVRELLADCQPGMQHSAFAITQEKRRYFREQNRPDAIVKWVQSSNDFHEALTELVLAKIQLLKYYKNDPEKIGKHGIRILVDPEKAENAPRRFRDAW